MKTWLQKQQPFVAANINQDMVQFAYNTDYFAAQTKEVVMF
jgi:hypothetical protein